MKKTLSFFLAIQLILLTCQLAQAQSVSLTQRGYSGASFSVTTPKIICQTKTVNGQEYTVYTFEGSSHLFREGEPDLPVLSQMIEIPICSEVQVSVSDIQTRNLEDLSPALANDPARPILPMQPAPCKSDRNPRPFVMDSSIYLTDAFYAAPEVAWVDRVGIARDRNLATLRFSPISYNPVTGQMQVITSVTITLTYKDADEPATRQLKERYYSPDFSLGTAALNTLPESKSVRNAAPLHYLIVAHSSFRDALDTFVNWKKRQGFLVTVGYTDQPEVGTTTTSIASYIKSFYTSATEELPAPTYLLLVGDYQQVPVFDSRCSSPASDHITDLYYTTWTEGDNIPDCYLGRFSARTVAELTPQIEKSIYYESYAFDDDSYLAHGVLIAGEDQGSTGDNAYTYADPAMDYVAKLYLNAGNGYNTVHYYKNNINFAPNGVHVDGSSQTAATASYLRTLYNQGCGWVNYTAHGFDNEWSTPNFNSNNASAMTNYNMPSIMIGNCCLSGKFNTTYSDACLGEALLRREQNAGASAYIGATNSTYWPQDFCWEVGLRNNISNTMNTDYNHSYMGVYDRMFHTHNEPYSDWHITTGSMVTAGNTAVEQYGTYALYYWEIYELFGDPSLMPWLGQASDLTIEYQNVVPLDSDTYTVQTVPYAYVAITTSNEHQLVAATYANGNGYAELTLANDINPGRYELAVWAQNYKPEFREIQIIVLDGPYVIVTGMQPEGDVKPGSIVYFDYTITNVGNDVPTAGEITLTSNTEGVTFIQPLARFTRCNPNDTVELHTMTPVYLSDDFSDGATIQFTAEVNYGRGTSAYRKSLHVSAPRITASQAQATPQLNPESSSIITCSISNRGSSALENGTFTLRNDFGFLSNTPDPVHLDALAAGESRTISFHVALNSEIPQTVVPFYLYLTTDDKEVLVDTLRISCGINHYEDFETADFNSFSWTQNNRGWEITSGGVAEGSFCARSRTGLGGRSESRMSITWTSSNNDSISFYYKVSSEEGYDLFKFIVDGDTRLTASGEEDWTRASFPVSAGTHIFSFSYTKDFYYDRGSDCAWIDNVTLPFNGTIYQFDIDQTCKNNPYEFGEEAISTTQTGTFSYVDSTVIPWHYLALTVLDEPTVSIEIIGADNHCMLLKGHGADSYVWSTGDTANCIAVCPENTITYSVTGFRGGCSGEASTTLLAIDEPLTAEEVMVYPNPAHNQVTITAQQIHSISLVSILGQTLLQENVNANSTTLNLQTLPNGIYFIRIKTADSIVTKKLIKK